MKKVWSSLLMMLILANSFCFASLGASKEETVYVNLDYEGNVEQINIYNKCVTNGVEQIEDYTPFEEVTNLTNQEKVQKEEDKILWNTKELATFSYTGKVSGDYYEKLPWNFKVSYQLNGVDKNPEDLLHQKGLIKITMDIIANENTNDYFRNNYMLEVTGNYDMSKFLSVASEEAIVANAGNTKTLMFIVLPGQSTTLHIELGSDDFEMDGITMAIVKVSGNILDTVSRLAEEKEDIKEMLDSLDESTDIILNSLGNMNGGLNGISSGVSAIQQGTKEIHHLQNVRDEDMASFQTELEEVLPLLENIEKDVDHLTQSYEIIIDGSTKLNEKLLKIQSDVTMLQEHLESLKSSVNDLPDDVVTINDTLKDLAKAMDNLNGLLSTSTDMSQFDSDSLASNLRQIGKDAQTIAGVATTLENPEVAAPILQSVGDISNSLTSIQATLGELEELSQGAVSVGDLTTKSLKNLKSDFNALSEILEKKQARVLVEAYEDILEVTKALEETLEIFTATSEELLTRSGDYFTWENNLKASIDQLKQMDMTLIHMIGTIQQMLSSLSTKIYEGTNEVGDAVLSVNRELTSITSQSHQFKETKNKVKDMIEKENDKLEEETTILNVDKDAKVESFGSTKNEVSSVQFLLKTKDIKEIKNKVKDLEQEEETITLLERIKVVFQKIVAFLQGLFK